IVEYVNESEHMGIEILPPDINESDALFKVVDGKNIRFGLLAVKNVGKGAVESIVESRVSSGRYKSLEDLCRRIDLRLANRKVLESLIKCGALDTLVRNRAQMFASLENILEYSSKVQRERSSGQISFFDAPQEDGKGFVQIIPNTVNIKEWPEPQLLAFEKEMIGFYVSGHPLSRYARQLKRFTSSQIDVLPLQKDQDTIKLIGMIVKIKHTVTRAKQEKMAILKLEDLKAIVEVLVFPKTFQKVSRYLQPNSVVMVKGKLNLKEESPKILADDLFPIEEVYKLITGLTINVSGIRDSLFSSLRSLLLSSPGNIPVFLHLDTPSKSHVHLLVGENLFVAPSEQLINGIEDLLGEEKLSLSL
ncbi:MAG: OB-fold nucleic acid binding domain-containing protein, partial [Candidatus Omnitrophica bacterium]|nr:OB-fold nucleic acid binding domain-containing protein [Candidatus Omnitrophota bacterium]